MADWTNNDKNVSLEYLQAQDGEILQTQSGLNIVISVLNIWTNQTKS